MKKPSHQDLRADEARLASNEKTARLRALRLSKEAADREAAEQSAAAKREGAKRVAEMQRYLDELAAETDSLRVL